MDIPVYSTSLLFQRGQSLSTNQFIWDVTHLGYRKGVGDDVDDDDGDADDVDDDLANL